MDFFNKLGKKASETYQVTKEKTTKFSNEMKLKGKISDAKNRITSLYEEIGEHVYNGYKTNSEEGKEDIKAKCEEIAQKFDEISKLEAEILSLREVKKCTACGAEINQKDDFCSKCGKEQPKREEPVEIKQESEIQDVQDAEVVEVKNTEEEQNPENKEEPKDDSM